MSRTAQQQGFSLIELLVVLLILSVVMGAVFQQVNNVQQRSRTEQNRLDEFGEAREFMDEFVRDIHQAGYPDGKMFTTTPANTTVTVASGIVVAEPAWLVMEGDVDGSGNVSSVQYKVSPIGATCPCLLQRSQILKVAGSPLPNALGGNQGNNFSVEIQNVVNSGGVQDIAPSAGGLAPLAITGTTALLASRTGKGSEQTYIVNDDVYFANLKVQPVFTYYLKNSVVGVGNAGQAVPQANLPIWIGNDPNNILPNIGSVQIQMNIVSQTPDQATGIKPFVSLSAVGRVNNH